MWKKVKCPVCGFGRLIDAGVNVETQSYPVQSLPKGWKPDYIQKCCKCRSEIGIKRIK